MTDAELERMIVDHRSREEWEAAANLIMKHYGPRIRGLLKRRIRDEDVVNDVFSMFSEDLWRYLPGFRGSSEDGTTCKSVTWCFKVALSARSRYFRGERPERRMPLPESLSQLMTLAATAEPAPRQPRPKVEADPEDWTAVPRGGGGGGKARTGPETWAARRQLMERVLKETSDEEQELLYLNEVAEQSAKEIAYILGLPSAEAVRTRISRLKKKLRRLWKQAQL